MKLLPNKLISTRSTGNISFLCGFTSQIRCAYPAFQFTLMYKKEGSNCEIKRALASTIPHTYIHDGESVVKLSENSTLDKTF